MRAIKPNTRRRSLWRTVLLTLCGDCHRRRGDRGRPGGLEGDRPGKTGLLARDGKTDPRGLGRDSPLRKADRAYTKVTREYLTNPQTDQWFVTYVPPDKVPAGVIRDSQEDSVSRDGA